tara:strand:+ start:428 stop:667 length:240 start_codon:yes stop_codon:yes gene_type:complete
VLRDTTVDHDGSENPRWRRKKLLKDSDEWSDMHELLRFSSYGKRFMSLAQEAAGGIGGETIATQYNMIIRSSFSSGVSG